MKKLSRKRKRPQEEAHKENDNEMKKNLEELKENIEFLKKEIESLKQSYEKIDELINIILQKNIEVEESIFNLKKDNKLLKEKNQILEKEFDKIYPVALSCQLRKLLKKIFEFIVNDRYLSSGLIKIGTEVYFIMPNEYYSSYFSRHDMIQAFTLLLQIIQSYTLDCDHIIHYIDKNATFQDYLRKRINIFNNYSEFFRFFNIDKKYEEILIKYIPPYLFYSIDNYTFEEKMSSLIMKIK